MALALAEGARERCGADWGLATTGVAGPEPQDGKPVGMVFVAVAGPAGATVRELSLSGSRAGIRTASVTSRPVAARRRAAWINGGNPRLTCRVASYG